MIFLIDDVISITQKMKTKVMTYQDDEFEAETIWIQLLSRGAIYNMQIYEDKHVWRPAKINHFGIRAEKCYYCEHGFDNRPCEVLNEDLDEVFNHIMKHPKVRLRKLFF